LNRWELGAQKCRVALGVERQGKDYELPLFHVLPGIQIYSASYIMYLRSLPLSISYGIL
jgi:hypothetical protein